METGWNFRLQYAGNTA